MSIDMTSSPIEQSIERLQPDADLATRLVAARAHRTDLTDEEYFKEATKTILLGHLGPMLQDATDLHDEEPRDTVYPLAHTLARLANTITKDVVTLKIELEEL